MMLHCLLLTVFLSSVVWLSNSQFGVRPPPTVDTLNTEAFLGRWYQMYTSYLPQTTFEKNGYCVTNEYSPITETSFKMVSYAK